MVADRLALLAEQPGPGHERGDPPERRLLVRDGCLAGAILLGALCYATFDLTSQAVMKVMPSPTAIERLRITSSRWPTA